MKTERLQSVDAIRALRRKQVSDARDAALAGEPFAIVHSDEAEEVFTALGIGVQVINPWNFIIVSEGKAGHFNEVLHRHGFAGRHFFALGYASTLEPEMAPWGGLPKPAIIVGSTRDEAELRVTELWAREYGCAFFPLDFNLASPARLLPRGQWWNDLRDGWDRLVDRERLDLRVAQMRNLISRVEHLTGLSFSVGKLERLLEQSNRQMDEWARANHLIAEAEECPVSVRDQLAAYQMMWSRGSEEAFLAIRNYADEVEIRVAEGRGVYGPIRHRVFLSSMDAEPAFHDYIHSQHGAAFVGCPYATVPALYAREVKGDPLRALAARNLFLFAINDASWWVAQAQSFRASCAIAVERPSPYLSALAKAMKAAEISFLSVPSGADDAANRERIDHFFSTLDRGSLT